MLALDKVLNNLLLVECIRMTENMKSRRSPVESVDPKVFRQPVLEVVLFL
jgi:hypothetical protein